MRLGHFDAPGPLQQFPTSDICSSYAIELSNNGSLFTDTDERLLVMLCSLLGPHVELEEASRGASYNHHFG